MLKKIKAINKNIKILFISGYTFDLLEKQQILEEKINFVRKPFSAKELIQKIRYILDNPIEKNS